MGGISVILITGIFSILLILLIITVFCNIIDYIFESMSLYTLSKRLEYKHPILSWIPAYNKYVLGKVANKRKRGIFHVILNLSITILMFTLFCVPILIFPVKISDSMQNIFVLLTFILSIINFIININIYHKIYGKIMPKFNAVLTIINVFTLGVLSPVILFIIRNKGDIDKESN